MWVLAPGPTTRCHNGEMIPLTDSAPAALVELRRRRRGQDLTPQYLSGVICRWLEGLSNTLVPRAAHLALGGYGGPRGVGPAPPEGHPVRPGPGNQPAFSRTNRFKVGLLAGP